VGIAEDGTYTARITLDYPGKPLEASATFRIPGPKK